MQVAQQTECSPARCIQIKHRILLYLRSTANYQKLRTTQPLPKRPTTLLEKYCKYFVLTFNLSHFLRLYELNTWTSLCWPILKLFPIARNKPNLNRTTKSENVFRPKLTILEYLCPLLFSRHKHFSQELKTESRSISVCMQYYFVVEM